MDNKFTIFYTDDDPDDLDFFKEATSSIDPDLQVVTLKNAEQLLSAIDNPPPHPHILFLDLNMPGLTGFDALKILRERKQTKDLPIVILSTSSDEDYVGKSLELGANYYVQKPNTFDSLKNSIEHAISINWKKFIPTLQNFLHTT